MKTYFLILMVLLLAACKGEVAEESTNEVQAPGNELVLNEGQVNMAGVVSGKIEEKVLADVLTCNGYVRVPPRGQVSVSLPLEAYVREIHFHFGDKIEKGQLLAVMEHPEFLKLQQAFIETGNNLNLLKEDLDRQEALAKENAASQKILMSARTNYENSMAMHASLSGQIRLLGLSPDKVTTENLRSRVEVRAPITGFITDHNIKTGELMQPGEPIAEMVDITKLNLHLVVYEKDIQRVKEGQKVEFTTDAEGKTYKGEVHTKGKVIDPGNRSVDVHVHIINPDADLLSGMYVRAAILTGQSRVMAIPEAGVVNKDGQDYIFLREGNTFHKLAVETGLRKDGFVEILSPGSLTGRDIVLAGAYYLNAELSGEE